MTRRRWRRHCCCCAVAVAVIRWNCVHVFSNEINSPKKQTAKQCECVSVWVYARNHIPFEMLSFSTCYFRVRSNAMLVFGFENPCHQNQMILRLAIHTVASPQPNDVYIRFRRYAKYQPNRIYFALIFACTIVANKIAPLTLSPIIYYSCKYCKSN